MKTKQPARAAIFALGLSAVVAALVLWLIPTSSGTTTTREHSRTAVTDSTGGTNTTTVDRTMVTQAPGASRSDVVVVALLTFGGGLLLVASFWNRIHSLAIGGVSITLEDAAVTTPGIALVDTAAAHVEMRSSTAVDELVPQVASIGNRDLRLICVDLRAGDLWAPLNLSLFVLMLARRTKAEVIVFLGVGEPGSKTYFGAAAVEHLADKLAANDPDLAAAHRATETIPLDRSELTPGQRSIGRTFFDQLQVLDPSRAEGARAGEERVDRDTLQELAGRALITESVLSEGEQTLSSRQQRAVLAFPLRYVPITRRGTLEELIDRSRLAERIALSAVGAASQAQSSEGI
jgi:hypothetical protein